jgi:DNA anti-recombination protein RmuC
VSTEQRFAAAALQTADDAEQRMIQARRAGETQREQLEERHVAELADQHKQMEAKCAKLVGRCEELERQCGTLQRASDERLQVAESRLAQQEASNAKMEQELAALQDQIKYMGQQEKNAVVESRGRDEALHEELNSARQQLKRAQIKCAQFQQQLRYLRAEAAEAQKQTGTASSAAAIDLAAVIAELSTRVEEKRALEETCTALRQDLGTSREQVALLEQSLVSTEQRFAAAALQTADDAEQRMIQARRAGETQREQLEERHVAELAAKSDAKPAGDCENMIDRSTEIEAMQQLTVKLEMELKELRSELDAARFEKNQQRQLSEIQIKKLVAMVHTPHSREFRG